MHIPVTPIPSAESLLREYDQIDKTMADCERFMASLQNRKSAIEPLLDAATRPATPPPPSRSPMTVNDNVGVPVPLRRGYVYLGQFERHFTLIDLHLALLKRLFTDYPEKAEAIVRSVHKVGRNRRYISSDPGALFEEKDSAWVAKHNQPLINGLYVDTNLNRIQMRRVLGAAIRGAGLVNHQDVQIIWDGSYRWGNSAKAVAPAKAGAQLLETTGFRLSPE